MRAKAGILIIIGLLVLVGIGEAADTSTIGTSEHWVIANGIDQSTITVHVSNTNGINGVATVNFFVDNVSYGTVNPLTINSDSSAQTTF